MKHMLQLLSSAVFSCSSWRMSSSTHSSDRKVMRGLSRVSKAMRPAESPLYYGLQVATHVFQHRLKLRHQLSSCIAFAKNVAGRNRIACRTHRQAERGLPPRSKEDGMHNGRVEQWQLLVLIENGVLRMRCFVRGHGLHLRTRRV